MSALTELRRVCEQLQLWTRGILVPSAFELERALLVLERQRGTDALVQPGQIAFLTGVVFALLGRHHASAALFHQVQSDEQLRLPALFNAALQLSRAGEFETSTDVLMQVARSLSHAGAEHLGANGAGNDAAGSRTPPASVLCARQVTYALAHCASRAKRWTVARAAWQSLLHGGHMPDATEAAQSTAAATVAEPIHAGAPVCGCSSGAMRSDRLARALAHAQLESGQAADARRICTAALAVYTDDPALLMLLADAQRLQGAPADALASLDSAVRVLVRCTC